MEGNIEKLQKIIDESSNIVFFGGAGVSTESGIPDFRSTSGLYHQQWQYPPETILSHTFFENETKEFYRFYKEKILIFVEPNPAHIKLAELEKCKKLSAIVTQNIDGLHQKAGSENVFELHGSIHRNYCLECGSFYSGEEVATLLKESSDGIPRCPHCKGLIKPDVVLYEEGLDDRTVSGAVSSIAKADTLIIGGTSLVVYPAASLIHYFKGKNLVLINKSSTSCDSQADLIIKEPIGEVLSKIKINS